MLPKGLLKEYSRALALLIRLLDMSVVLFAGVVTYWVRFVDTSIPPDYQIALIAGTILTPIVFSFFDIYVSVRGRGLTGHFVTLMQALVTLMLLLAGLSFFTKSGDHFSRIWFVSWMLTAVTFLIVYRCGLLLVLRLMRTRGMNERVVVIFGATELGERFANVVQQALWTGFRILHFVDDAAQLKSSTLAGVTVIQTPTSLREHLKQFKVDELWLALPLHAKERVKEIMYELRHDTINIRFVLDILDLDLINHSIDDVAGFPVLNISATPMAGINRFIKALEDRIIAAFILAMISPILMIIALGVKLTSRGPVLFRQKRHGWDGCVIQVYKFRTMYLHQEADGKVTQASAADTRITPFGRFLRRTSLDELPQFINVLQGRMSIVGPRPHAIAHNEQYKEMIHTYMQRHRVKPGITGWAQINGWRGETDTLEKMQKRVEYDLYYINNWSLSFDLKIILLTLFRGFINQNAY